MRKSVVGLPSVGIYTACRYGDMPIERNGGKSESRRHYRRENWRHFEVTFKDHLMLSFDSGSDSVRNAFWILKKKKKATQATRHLNMFLGGWVYVCVSLCVFLCVCVFVCLSMCVWERERSNENEWLNRFKQYRKKIILWNQSKFKNSFRDVDQGK